MKFSKIIQEIGDDEFIGFFRSADDENELLYDIATLCHPKDNNRKHSMWIRVECGKGDEFPPHACLYSHEKRPTKNTLITKFLLTETPPNDISDIKAMEGCEEIPFEYANMVIHWAKEINKFKLTNWVNLLDSWNRVKCTFDY